MAAEALLAVYAGAHAQEVLQRRLAQLPEKERQLGADLVYGVLRQRIRLAHILGQVLARPGKLPPLMLVLLELAAYSLFLQSGAPDYAILNETVKLIKKNSGQRLANVANGALRSLVKLAPQIANMDWYGANGQSLFYAMPGEIASIWRSAYGAAAANALMARSQARPWSGVRVNLRHPDGEPILRALLAQPCAQQIANAGAAFPPGKMPVSVLGKPVSELAAQGALSLQAAGSQLILRELGLYPDWQGAPIWDSCAGIGGKSAVLLENGLDVVLATDLNLKRLARLPGECQRLGLNAPMLAQADAAAAPLANWQGNILIDAPCSGLGVLSRRPDIKMRFGARKLAELVAIQKRILAGACALLAPGAELAYLTCTLNPAENEQQIAPLLARGLELVAEWQTPHDHPWLEGMYGARLRKKSALSG